MVRIGADAQRELRGLAVHALRRIIAAVDRELTHQPLRDHSPRKLLRPDPDAGIIKGIAVWQLRVGDYRVFYDVDQKRRTVMVQRVLWKGRKTTRDILR